MKYQTFMNVYSLRLQESNTLPLPKLEGNDRAQARALATIHSHPVVSLSGNAFYLLYYDEDSFENAFFLVRGL